MRTPYDTLDTVVGVDTWDYVNPETQIRDFLGLFGVIWGYLFTRFLHCILLKVSFFVRFRSFSRFRETRSVQKIS